ncbi:MAG: helix-turn-helix transcriptional regulator, partial [Oscillospiraceae bacterium]|nr:helix-turn-helix transcriptional regulator [Oscillospiraceae bacterium]
NRRVYRRAHRHGDLTGGRQAFSYHPNYISTLLPKQIGKTFSQLLLEQRMERAAALLRGTALPVSQIAELLGYSNSSNFYKAFRAYYGVSPREYQRRSELGERP